MSLSASTSLFKISTSTSSHSPFPYPTHRPSLEPPVFPFFHTLPFPSPTHRPSLEPPVFPFFHTLPFPSPTRRPSLEPLASHSRPNQARRVTGASVPMCSSVYRCVQHGSSHPLTTQTVLTRQFGDVVFLLLTSAGLHPPWSEAVVLGMRRVYLSVSCLLPGADHTSYVKVPQGQSTGVFILARTSRRHETGVEEG